ncbi:MAG TPA: hypothetical protein VK911_11385 [Vicinamibacterales bacterium]|nr:hypothetical protein [Vicinamibacterales bacterium]
MTGPTYLAARVAAAAVRPYFADCLARSRGRGVQEIGPEPDERTIEEIVSAGFWSSLRREEGRVPKISLAYLPPEQAAHAIVFGRRLSLDPGILAKVAPAVERPGIHLGVWRVEGELCVWGATRTIPPSCFVLEVIEPGLLVVKRRRTREGGKYANVAVLQGDQVKIVDEGGGELSDALPQIASSLGFASSRTWTDPVNLVVQLALSMRAHGHGGVLLIVPGGSDAWQKSVVHPVPYLVVPSFAELAGLLRQQPEEKDEPAWREAVRRAVDAIAGLTAVDGATVMTDRYELLAFGVKIRRSVSSEPVQRVVMAEPVVGSPPVAVDPTQLGGTRHLSAAQFVHDQRDALALVASQDGRFTVFAWPPGRDVVHAHRVETLLL